MIACDCSCVKSLESASGIYFFCESFMLVSSRFVFKVMFVEWPVEEFFGHCLEVERILGFI